MAFVGRWHHAPNYYLIPNQCVFTVTDKGISGTKRKYDVYLKLAVQRQGSEERNLNDIYFRIGIGVDCTSTYIVATDPLYPSFRMPWYQASGTIEYADAFAYPSGWGTGPTITNDHTFTIEVDAGTHSIYPLIDCLDMDWTGCGSRSGSFRNVIVGDALSVTAVVEQGPYAPTDLSVSYSDGNISTSWIDNLGTSTKSFDYVKMYVDDVLVWQDSVNATSKSVPYNISPGSKVKFTVYTYSTSGNSSPVSTSSEYTVPGSYVPSVSLSLSLVSADDKMYVNGNYQVTATASIVGGTVVSNPYTWDVWFYDSHNPPNSKHSTGTTSLSTHSLACKPADDMGSVYGETLYADAIVKVKYYYYTPRELQPALYNEAEVSVNADHLTIGVLQNWYVKVITSASRYWAIAKVIETGSSKLITYDKFKIK